jgi:hypothetical protein
MVTKELALISASENEKPALQKAEMARISQEAGEC